jgi:predicted thioesterase
MEDTASNIVIYKLPKNYRPVGTKINIDHINSTPINMKVTVKATLIAVEGKKFRYNVEAFNEESKIGFGIYEQSVINLTDFLDNN